MTCLEIRHRLPLFVEGDLPASDDALVREHLAACLACRAEETVLNESQAFWKSAPEPSFDESFHADVRRAVRLEIAARNEARARGWTIVRAWSTLAGAAAALGVVFLLLHERRPAPPREMRAIPAPTAVSAPEPVRIAEAPAPAAEPARAMPTIRHRPALAKHPRRPAGTPRVTRIEMATSNPHVRIIWLANASDAAPI